MKFDSNGWLDVAVEIDYLNKSMSREGNAIKYLILHGTAGGTSAQAIANYFATGGIKLVHISSLEQMEQFAKGYP